MAKDRLDLPRNDDLYIKGWGPLEEAELMQGLQELIEAQQNAGYPALEAVPDEEAKARQELSDCEDFAAELRVEFGIALCGIEKNPKQSLPDCFARIDGERVGIEVTRLTLAPQEIAWQKTCLRSNIEAFCSHMETDDPVRAGKIWAALAAKPFKFSAVLKHIASYDQVLIEPPRPEWPSDYFQERLQAAIRQKEDIAAQRAQEGGLEKISKLFLLIRTHEYNLTEDRVGEHLQRVEVPILRQFEAAYLILPARPKDGPGRCCCPLFKIPPS